MPLACANGGFAPSIAHHAGEWGVGTALMARGLGVALVPRRAYLPSGHPSTRVPLSEPAAAVRTLRHGARHPGGQRNPEPPAGAERSPA